MMSVIISQLVEAPAETKKEDFSFLVFGDNRLPGHLPYTRTQKNKINAFFNQVKKYAFGPGVKLSFDLGFDPNSHKLIWLKMWPQGIPNQYQIMTLKNGWPELMLRGIPPRVALRSEGQAWVYTSIIRDIKRGVDTENGPTFCLNTGDMTYNGHQGKTRKKSPYWSDFYKRFYIKLPEGSPEGLPARFFPAPGNHESWADEELRGFRSTFPYLKKLGFSKENRTYMFDHKQCRFIFLDTGDMDYKNPSAWGGKHPDFKGQMQQLTGWLKEAEENNTRHVFITYHNPSFCRAGFGPLPEGNNPHLYIKSFADDLDITVFNGHVHTTEAYKVDGIRYLVLGAGGGEQKYGANQMPRNYPADLYWKGNPRVEDYNYLEVKISGNDLRFIIKRYRPTEEEKLQNIEIY